MLKSYVRELLRLYRAILKDCRYMHPTLRKEFRKDFRTLKRLSQARGVYFFLVDLPRLGKHLDRCLSRGQYISPSRCGGSRVSREEVIPKLFRGLFLLVFEKDGGMLRTPNLEAILCLRELFNAAKKVPLPCAARHVKTEFENFVKRNEQLETWNALDGFWDDTKGRDDEELKEYYAYLATGRRMDSFLRELNSKHSLTKEQITRFKQVLREIARHIGSTLGPYNPEEWKCKHGPGAVAERIKSSKYHSMVWNDEVDTVFPADRFAFASPLGWVDEGQNLPYDDNPSSRLVAVPKTYLKPRLIAAEPVSKMWCQQNIWHYFKERAEATWIGDFIRFTDQSQNQNLALEGSETGQSVTIDLSEASDRVTTDHALALFVEGNYRLLQALRSTRTRYTNIDSDATGSHQIVKLSMYATMGNATTFPVESLVFLWITLSATTFWWSLKGEKVKIWDLYRQVSIFGDDLIVPKYCGDFVMDCLESFGFKINRDKTFSEGNFRESCGVDAFGGHDVTPVYWRGPLGKNPESIASYIATRNNFYNRGWTCVAHMMDSTMRRLKVAYVPVDSGCLGLETRCKLVGRGPFKSRWNEDLQCVELLVPQILMRSPVTRTDGWATLLQYFTEEPHPGTPWTAGYQGKPRFLFKKRWTAWPHN